MKFPALPRQTRHFGADRRGALPRSHAAASWRGDTGRALGGALRLDITQFAKITPKSHRNRITIGNRIATDALTNRVAAMRQAGERRTLALKPMVRLGKVSLSRVCHPHT